MTAMNDSTGGNRGRRPAAALAAAAAIAVLTTACSVQTTTSISYPVGPAGSAAYRQLTVFVQCVRNHGAPGFPDPIPGGSIAVQVTSKGTVSGDPPVAACQYLLPHDGQKRETTNVGIG
jgi:hypothetical protein